MVTVESDRLFAKRALLRKPIQQGFGWAKTVGPIRQVMVRGLKKVDQICADHDRLQPHAHAHAGKNPSSAGVKGGSAGKRGSKKRVTIS